MTAGRLGASIAALLVATAAACGGAPATPPPTEPAAAQTAGGERIDPACGKGRPRDPHCTMVARDRCFDTVEDACACQGCPVDRCDSMYSLPPQAACR